MKKNGEMHLHVKNQGSLEGVTLLISAELDFHVDFCREGICSRRQPVSTGICQLTIAARDQGKSRPER